MKKKRGLSTIVMTMILIVISLVAVGIFWIVIRNVVKGGTEQVGLGKFTVDADIKNVNVDNSSNNVSFTVQRNAGEGEVSGIKFIFSNETGTETITENIVLKELEPKRFIFHLGMNVSGITKISIAPIFSSNGKETYGNVIVTYDVKKGISFKVQNSSCNPVSNPCGSAVCGTATNGTCGTVGCGTFGNGSCQTGYSCVSGSCVAIGCTPVSNPCGSAVCGTAVNGTCGTVSCGTCGTGYNCVGGSCVSSCTPVSNPCGSAVCGTAVNGTCGSVSCGTCGTGFNCVGGSCVSSTYTCGNNIVEPGEACDGTNVNGYTCATVAAGFVSGTLSCSSDCKRYITTSCVAGNTINAESCSQTDVQDAITLANDGDTVNVPEGTCTWISGITINKRIILRGAGQDKTIITSNIAGVLLSAGSASRITQLGFILQNDNGGGINIGGKNWRIDHCSFKNFMGYIIEGITSRDAGTFGYHPLGVIDHCEFLNTRIVSFGDLSLMANAIWKEPLGLGTNNAVFAEDNTMSYTIFSNAIDSNYGGRYVFRYNQITDSYIEAHAVQGENRAARSWEIYNNELIQQNLGIWVTMFLRGGTGVVFNNRIMGTWNSDLGLNSRRSCDTFSVSGKCDGTSLWDGNEAGQNGYPCRDQPGRSTDQWLWTASNPYPPQELDPVYEWNNLKNGNDISFFSHDTCSANHIQEGREFYNDIQRPNYVPYPYPHPIALIN